MRRSLTVGGTNVNTVTEYRDYPTVVFGVSRKGPGAIEMSKEPEDPQDRRPAAGGGRPRGRPPGTVSLTDEIAEKIVAFIRGGAFDYVAALAAGVADRTFRDWMARGEGRHLNRPPSPKLRRFATAVRQAQAEARIGAEIRVYREQPRYWLAHAARSTPERAGWTLTKGQQPLLVGTLEERLRELDERDALLDPADRSD